MAKHKQQLELNQISEAQLDQLPKLNLNAAGLDISADGIYAAVPADREGEKSLMPYTEGFLAIARYRSE
ncbi:MAG: hypothetical protein P8186_31500 [Anaerolineae bacterium]|jgi:hypothetical protein